MRLRVVCGFEVTMATFCPTRRFNKVDFPAFGRPTIATNPDRNVPFCFVSVFSTLTLFSIPTVNFESFALIPFCFSAASFHHRQFQGALMLAIMDQRNGRRPRIL